MKRIYYLILFLSLLGCSIHNRLITNGTVFLKNTKHFKCTKVGCLTNKKVKILFDIADRYKSMMNTQKEYHDSIDNDVFNSKGMELLSNDYNKLDTINVQKYVQLYHNGVFNLSIASALRKGKALVYDRSINQFVKEIRVQKYEGAEKGTWGYEFFLPGDKKEFFKTLYAVI